MYTLMAFFIVMALLGFMTIFCGYCGKRFGCRFILYALWIIFAVFSIIGFLASGFLVIGVFTANDGCGFYDQISGNSSAIQTLSYYQTSEVVQVL